jgi:hypothetical protein
MTVQQLIDKLNTIDDKDNIVVMTRGYEGGYDDIDNIIPEPITMALNINDEWYFGKHEKLSEVYDREDIEEYTITKAVIL